MRHTLSPLVIGTTGNPLSPVPHDVCASPARGECRPTIDHEDRAPTRVTDEGIGRSIASRTLASVIDRVERAPRSVPCPPLWFCDSTGTGGTGYAFAEARRAATADAARTAVRAVPLSPCPPAVRTSIATALVIDVGSPRIPLSPTTSAWRSANPGWPTIDHEDRARERATDECIGRSSQLTIVLASSVSPSTCSSWACSVAPWLPRRAPRTLWSDRRCRPALRPAE